MSIKFLNPKEVPNPIGNYSNVAVVPEDKKILFLAGQIGNDHTGIVSKKLEDQYGQALKNINEIIKSQGGDKKNLVRITVFLTEKPSDRQLLKKQAEKYLNDPPPAMSWIYVSELATPDLKVEIEAVAAI